MGESLTEQTALRLIARAEQSVFGLTRKLRKRGHSDSSIQIVIARLRETGLVDDRRYARLWLESRLNRASSPWRLRAALHARGIDNDDADYAMEKTLDEDAEQQLLRRYVEKLNRKGKYENPADAETARQLRYLLKSEGFSSSAVRRFFD